MMDWLVFSSNFHAVSPNAHADSPNSNVCLPQIMLVGISTCPWECDQKSLAQTYQKMIYIPRPDYASLSFIWTELLFSYPSVSRQFNCSTLAKLSDGYTVGTILRVVREVGKLLQWSVFFFKKICGESSPFLQCGYPNLRNELSSYKDKTIL